MCTWVTYRSPYLRVLLSVTWHILTFRRVLRRQLLHSVSLVRGVPHGWWFDLCAPSEGLGAVTRALPIRSRNKYHEKALKLVLVGVSEVWYVEGGELPGNPVGLCRPLQAGSGGKGQRDWVSWKRRDPPWPPTPCIPLLRSSVLAPSTFQNHQLALRYLLVVRRHLPTHPLTHFHSFQLNNELLECWNIIISQDQISTSS